MLKGIKKILGIEGVVIELVVPEEINTKESKEIKGQLNFLAKGDSKVVSLEFRLIEKYKRGRKESKLIDEYTLGKVTYNDEINLAKGEQYSFPFVLPFNLVQSDMDRLSRSNLIFKGLVGLAKLMKGASSSYRVECKVSVEGTKLNPHTTKEVILK